MAAVYNSKWRTNQH